jgi:hypothetical protein
MSTYAERRQDFIEHMERVVREPRVWNFDMTIWLKGTPELDCGTAACALGSYVASSDMAKAEGFELERTSVPRQYRPVYKNNLVMYSAQLFFDLPTGDAGRIFLPENYPAYTHAPVTAEMVLERAKEVFGV